MKARVTVALLVALVLVTSANHLHGQKIIMIVDQDARGPATTDMQSILIFLQAARFVVLGFTSVNFIVRMVHKYPGEVVVWAGGPLTNIALALRLDPQVATLAKELVLMGSGMYADNGGISGVDGRREFNWWFDPEAVRIVMRAPWKKIAITPIDISVKTKLGPEIKAAIAKADTPVAR